MIPKVLEKTKSLDCNGRFFPKKNIHLEDVKPHLGDYTGVGKSRFTIVNMQSRIYSCIIYWLLYYLLYLLTYFYLPLYINLMPFPLSLLLFIFLCLPITLSFSSLPLTSKEEEEKSKHFNIDWWINCVFSAFNCLKRFELKRKLPYFFCC